MKITPADVLAAQGRDPENDPAAAEPPAEPVAESPVAESPAAPENTDNP